MDKSTKYNSGIELLKAGNHKEALNLFNELLEAHPLEADYWSERGVIHYHLKNKKEALNDMDKALSLEPTKGYRYSSRAYIRGHYGMTVQAIEDYNKAVEIDPEDAISYNNLGLLEEQFGYKNAAQKRFKKADDLMKGKEMGNQVQEGIHGAEIPERNIQIEIDEQAENRTIWSVIKTIGTKEGIDSFSRFIRSGFKKH